MTEQPRDWDKELADIDKAIARQPGAAPPPAPAPGSAGPVSARPGLPLRRFAALAWFWTVVAIVLGVALIVWPYDRSCGIRLIFFLGAALLALVLAVVGAFASWAHRQGTAMLLSLAVIVLAGIMITREILPRAGYAKNALDWTCPPPPPVPNPPPTPSNQ